jgi:hypothetical protein
MNSELESASIPWSELATISYSIVSSTTLSPGPVIEGSLHPDSSNSINDIFKKIFIRIEY